MDNDTIRAAREVIEGANGLLVVTGAGISAESGIPTFRGEGGLWEGFRAEDLATVAAFTEDPARVWRWYRWRRGICNDASPNAGHGALVSLERRVLERHGWTASQGLAEAPFLLASQNVDGLHLRAGSRALVELHGNIDLSRCTACSQIGLIEEDPHSPAGPVPLCERCGAPLRPHILWFGESYWPGVIELCLHHAHACDVVLVVGTSGMVWPPVAVALRAKETGATLIDVNPNPSTVSENADLWLQGPAGEVLPQLLGVDEP